MLREEKKFVLDSHQAGKNIRNLVEARGYRIEKVYKVYSIYFDFINYTNAHDHLEGNFRRSKYRLRFYTDTNNFLVNGFFWEEKIKEGNIGSKKRLSISEFDQYLGSKVTGESELLSFASKLVSEFKYVDQLKTVLPPLIPVVLIGYVRTRFSSFYDEANIDERIVFSAYHGASFGHLISSDSNVLEVKTPLTIRGKGYTNLDSNMPLPRTRFSKYLFSLSKLGILIDY